MRILVALVLVASHVCHKNVEYVTVFNNVVKGSSKMCWCKTACTAWVFFHLLQQKEALETCWWSKQARHRHHRIHLVYKGFPSYSFYSFYLLKVQRTTNRNQTGKTKRNSFWFNMNQTMMFFTLPVRGSLLSRTHYSTEKNIWAGTSFGCRCGGWWRDEDRQPWS